LEGRCFEIKEDVSSVYERGETVELTVDVEGVRASIMLVFVPLFKNGM
jgi:hypothetical protein